MFGPENSALTDPKTAIIIITAVATGLFAYLRASGLLYRGRDEKVIQGNVKPSNRQKL